MITFFGCGRIFRRVFCRETNFVRCADVFEGTASTYSSPLFLITVTSGMLRMKTSTEEYPNCLKGN